MITSTSLVTAAAGGGPAHLFNPAAQATKGTPQGVPNGSQRSEQGGKLS